MLRQGRNSTPELFSVMANNSPEDLPAKVVDAVKQYIKAVLVVEALTYSKVHNGKLLPNSTAEKAKVSIYAMRKRDEIIRDLLSEGTGTQRNAIAEMFRKELKRQLDDEQTQKGTQTASSRG